MASTTCEMKARVFMGKIALVIVMFVQLAPPHVAPPSSLVFL
jgi:hypothetical protein